MQAFQIQRKNRYKFIVYVVLTYIHMESVVVSTVQAFIVEAPDRNYQATISFETFILSYEKQPDIRAKATFMLIYRLTVG